MPAFRRRRSAVRRRRRPFFRARRRFNGARRKVRLPRRYRSKLFRKRSTRRYSKRRRTLSRKGSRYRRVLRRRSRKGYGRRTRHPSRGGSLPASLPLPRRHRLATFSPVDRFRTVLHETTGITSVGYKSPLGLLYRVLDANDVNQCVTLAAAEYLRQIGTPGAGADANMKYPSGVQVRAQFTFTFYPYTGSRGYVRLYKAYPVTYPFSSSRSIISDINTSYANSGVPQTFEANDFTYTDVARNYFTQPWVSVYENKALLQNWKIKPWKSFKVGPGIRPKKVVVRSSVQNFGWEELYQLSTYVNGVQTNPKRSYCILYEVVGENVIFDNNTTPSDSNFMIMPAPFGAAIRLVKDVVYRPMWEHRNQVNTTSGVPSFLDNTTTTKPIKYITWHQKPRLGVVPLAFSHPANMAVVGAENYWGASAGSIARHGAGFFADPVDTYNNLYYDNLGNYQDSDNFYAGGFGSTVFNAIKTAAT